jgi:hypothetical protein
MKLTDSNKAMIGSYLRAFLVACLVSIQLGKTEPKEIAMAGLLAVSAPLLRALNPKDGAFGMVDKKALKKK